MERGRREVIFAAVIMIALLISGVRLILESSLSINPPDCMIEYGYGRCIDGYLRIPFYNPNQQEITRIKIVVPFGIETNISLPADYTVNEPLKSGKTGVLKLIPCERDIDIRTFSLEWCCSEKCYRSSMSRISDKVVITR